MGNLRLKHFDDAKSPWRTDAFVIYFLSLCAYLRSYFTSESFFFNSDVLRLEKAIFMPRRQWETAGIMVAISSLKISELILRFLRFGGF